MSSEDQAFVASLVEKYVNTGTPYTEEDKARMLELTRKYGVKINRNPRELKSRFARTHQNPRSEKGGGIPYVRREPKDLSKKGKRKLAARIRKQDNRDRHHA